MRYWKFWHFALCSIENFEFIVHEQVQVNPDNSQTMSVLTFLLFKLNTLHKETLHWNHYIWVSRSHGVMTVVRWIKPWLLHYDNEVKVVVSSQPSITWYKSANQKIAIRTVYESWIMIIITWRCSFFTLLDVSKASCSIHRHVLQSFL